MGVDCVWMVPRLNGETEALVTDACGYRPLCDDGTYMTVSTLTRWVRRDEDLGLAQRLEQIAPGQVLLYPDCDEPDDLIWTGAEWSHRNTRRLEKARADALAVLRGADGGGE